MQPEESSPVFYLSADLSVPGRFSTQSVQAAELRLIGHFYIKTENNLAAGACAADFCRLNGIRFKDYLSFPVPITAERIREFEPEHQTAFDVATRDGEAVVVSVVFGSSNP